MTPFATVHDRIGRWQTRVDRAKELQARYPAAAAALRLYSAALSFQSDAALGCHTVLKPDVPLRAQIDIRSAASRMPGILSVADQYGPETLANDALRLRQIGEEGWITLLESVVSKGRNLNGTDDFFARACLQPYAEILQTQFTPSAELIPSNCPACGGLPQMSVLRPEGEGASRSLICSFCLREWPYRRLACPWCAEEDKEKLPRYTAQECSHVHVEACDSCKHYLKTIDMTIDGLAVPLVDEAALAVLDVWAVDRGYNKIVTNLLGF